MNQPSWSSVNQEINRKSGQNAYEMYIFIKLFFDEGNWKQLQNDLKNLMAGHISMKFDDYHGNVKIDGHNRRMKFQTEGTATESLQIAVKKDLKGTSSLTTSCLLIV